MKTIDKIPTSKIQRASKLFKTGAKVGVNYMSQRFVERLVEITGLNALLKGWWELQVSTLY